ncbi:Mitochondrial import inner membrane translocase subunit [Colletotrichum fructicola]|uniref:Mitochondrial import inner membrane translocase subunit TIM54 n=1 Tax=Colletotrichum fructicola (strain Nara gc5) TaxID=1213859 RepID=A0A7J6ICS0_COLFN|nr:Mitochondrial import inner membrane translocase subunit [Colletotrichum fructicola]KAE9574378.1 Mitochondrial import inner membrane translocase subunit [Colletotrichum fructicola]KAF4431734.1 Mitochondrial import inner membrane translocase subunit tim54 [Colletotrichum fructicola]KAF4474137.1 Mitochondrial import inner membrane translocase subunit tim54 [Colletotrichum fructicola Nara gc5]KAF4884540.1 Mitochondrial import inner membrane translocase subunit tim54 [Colletotrichum fructicola]
MADSKPPTPPEATPPAPSATTPPLKPTPTSTTTTAAPGPSVAEAYKAPKPNPVWQMLGMRGPPKRLPSRNWMIFLSLTAAFSSAVIYDKREKKRATARWARAVAPLAAEPIANPSQLPRRLTVLIEAPPGDGLRVAQDHFLEYVKPILAASGLDWEFVQGRQQGDVRAAVAEKIRRRRSREERPDVELLPTEENLRDAMRQKNGVPEYDGPGGDIVIGRHAWKEYIRGLHEGWLGPLDPPPKPEEDKAPKPDDTTAAATTDGETPKKEEEQPKPEEEEKKPARPPQPIPHNTTADYQAAHLPPSLPAEFSPSEPIPFPHLLGFSGTFTRLGRFLNRRRLADDIGRQVAAVCFAHAREYRPTGDPECPYEQQAALAHEERDWVKSAYKKPEDARDDEERAELSTERIWTSPVVVDPRIAERMRRFEIAPEVEERARTIEVPETEVEGWIKSNLRALGIWTWETIRPAERKGPNVGNVDDE